MNDLALTDLGKWENARASTGFNYFFLTPPLRNLIIIPAATNVANTDCKDIFLRNYLFYPVCAKTSFFFDCMRSLQINAHKLKV